MEGETWINAVAPRPETKSVNVVAVPRRKSPFVSSVGAENGILLQPGPRDNGNCPPEGYIVLPEGSIILPEGRRRPKVEAARRQDNAPRRRDDVARRRDNFH